MGISKKLRGLPRHRESAWFGNSENRCLYFKKMIVPPAPSSGITRMLSTRLLVKVLEGVPVSTENALGHPVEARTVERSLPRV
jgi:hypothetical protein